MSHQIEELKERVAKQLDVMEFLDILGFDMFDLVNALEEELVIHSVELEKACR